jgi:predicted RNA-binding protein YlqC (UPF0109 family)
VELLPWVTIFDLIASIHRGLGIRANVVHAEQGQTHIYTVAPYTTDDVAVAIGPNGKVAKGVRAIVEMIGQRNRLSAIYDVVNEPTPPEKSAEWGNHVVCV